MTRGYTTPFYFIFIYLERNCLKKHFLFLTLSSLLSNLLLGQTRFSIATDVSLLRNFSPQQKFWAFGQTVTAEFHFSPVNTFYAWMNYHTKGSFINHFSATAKSPATFPATTGYDMKGRWDFRLVSIGWKHFFRGGFNEASRMNYYGTAGFGLLFSKIENSRLTPVDTALYQLAERPLEGRDEFKRLTLDLSAGAEYPIGPGFFLYGALRTSIPTSDYPSGLLHNLRHVPLPVSFHAGLRILFGSDAED